VSAATQDWRARAACRSGVDPETFFPTAEGGPAYEAQVAVAKAVCAGCPVSRDCLREALVRLPYGIAGGLTPEERRRLARRARPHVVARRATAALEAGLRRGARASEVRAAGLVLLAAGRPASEVARRCGVTERTAQRWAATTSTSSRAGEGHGGIRALPLISHTPNPQAGTRTQEGPES
jgi:hypothetical protein